MRRFSVQLDDASYGKLGALARQEERPLATVAARLLRWALGGGPGLNPVGRQPVPVGSFDAARKAALEPIE